jgi:hypothetical protein
LLSAEAIPQGIKPICKGDNLKANDGNAS